MVMVVSMSSGRCAGCSVDDLINIALTYMLP